MSYISAKQLKEKYDITNQTLYNWRNQGKVKFKKINSRNFIYEEESIYTFTNKEQIKPKSVIYARVSNTKQKDDLINQERIIREFMASTGIIVDDTYKDIASGMNENRKGLNALIQDAKDGYIDKIYISFKDRLTRFGYGYLEKMFNMYGCEIICINSSKEEDFQTELTTDLISIIHHFSMKMYSNRRKILKSTNDLLKNT